MNIGEKPVPSASLKSDGNDTSDKLNCESGDSLRGLNKVLAKFGRMIVEAAERGDIGGVLWRTFRCVTFYLSLAYSFICVVFWLVVSWVGERNVTTAFLQYVPPFTWLLPFLLLLPLAMVFHRRCFASLLGLAMLLTWGWLGYGLRSSASQETSPSELTVMTYNRGQHMNQSLQPFKNAIHPDLLVFQDASGRAEGFLRSEDYAEFPHALSSGEFTLLSRFPIRESQLLRDSSDSAARAARFVIDWKGRAISVYAVHLNTPREVLGSYMRGAFLWGVLGLPGTPLAAKRLEYQKFWDHQIADAEKLISAAKNDANPTILAGDFNAPHTGYIHRLITQHFGDSHAAVGHGFGFTFPGATRNPLSLGGPWLRIDYIFYDRRWEPVDCITEKARASQHRAVAARLRLPASS